MTFQYHPPFPLRKDETPFRKLDCGGVRLENFGSREFLVVEREAIRALSEAAMTDINHLLAVPCDKMIAYCLYERESQQITKQFGIPCRYFAKNK